MKNIPIAFFPIGKTPLEEIESVNYARSELDYLGPQKREMIEAKSTSREIMRQIRTEYLKKDVHSRIFLLNQTNGNEVELLENDEYIEQIVNSLGIGNPIVMVYAKGYEI